MGENKEEKKRVEETKSECLGRKKMNLKGAEVEMMEQNRGTEVYIKKNKR